MLFKGQKCLLCKQTLADGESVRAFTAFLRRKSPYWRFSDAVMHEACFETTPERNEVLRLERRFWTKWDEAKEMVGDPPDFSKWPPPEWWDE